MFPSMFTEASRVHIILSISFSNHPSKYQRYD
jgi:hypothetical protein